jgi:hypothetical protein
LTTDGVETKTCKNCGATDGTRIIPKTGATLTITNFLDGDELLEPGKYLSGQVSYTWVTGTIVLVFSADVPVMDDGWAVVTGTTIPSSGSISLNIYEAVGTFPDYTFELYAGNDSGEPVWFTLYMTNSPNLMLRKGPPHLEHENVIRTYYGGGELTITNGNATINFGNVMQ